MTRNRPVILAEYDPLWTDKFKIEKQNLLRAAGEFFICIEHIGSTAIPGMIAKPTIDILAAITSLQETKSLIQAIAPMGYIYIPELEEELPERRYFYKERTHEDAFHLHVVEMDSSFWKRHIAFRDYLRAHPDEADAYAELKIMLAKEHLADRDAYTDGKSSFVHRIEILATGKSSK
jgi:GrpB-like predicted nucleotidyltransferase (UPF0157 family)